MHLGKRVVGRSFSFGLSALSFDSSAERSFYYEIDTPPNNFVDIVTFIVFALCVK